MRCFGPVAVASVPVATNTIDEVRDVGVADEVLGAVDHVVGAVATREGLHRAHVGAGLGLGHREAVDPLAADRRQEIALALLARRRRKGCC